MMPAGKAPRPKARASAEETHRPKPAVSAEEPARTMALTGHLGNLVGFLLRDGSIGNRLLHGGLAGRKKLLACRAEVQLALLGQIPQ